MISLTNNDVHTGFIEEIAGSSIDNFSARATRSQTLDSGSVVDYRGFIKGDQILKLKLFPNAEQYEIIKEILESGVGAALSCVSGFYIGYISNMTGRGAVVDITFMPVGY